MVNIKKLLAVTLTALSLGVATSAVAYEHHQGPRYDSSARVMQVDHRDYGNRHYRGNHPRYNRHRGWHKKPHYYGQRHRYNRHDRWDRRYDGRHRSYRSSYVW